MTRGGPSQDGPPCVLLFFFGNFIALVSPLYISKAVGNNGEPLLNLTYVKMDQQMYNGAMVLMTSKKKTIKKYLLPHNLPQLVAPQLCEP